MNDTKDSVTDALRRAFGLGQTYWQQADSEYTSQHRKADATRDKFQELCERTEDVINTLRAQLAEAQKNEKRYLWMRDKETSEGWDIIGRSGTPDQIDAAIDAAKENP